MKLLSTEFLKKKDPIESNEDRFVTYLHQRLCAKMFQIYMVLLMICQRITTKTGRVLNRRVQNQGSQVLGRGGLNHSFGLV